MKNSNPHNFRKFPKTSIAEFNFSEVTRPKPVLLGGYLLENRN